jgi:hypothetical protein
MFRGEVMNFLVTVQVGSIPPAEYTVLSRFASTTAEAKQYILKLMHLENRSDVVVSAEVQS